MQIDNQIASRRRRSGRANSNHIPDGTAAVTRQRYRTANIFQGAAVVCDGHHTLPRYHLGAKLGLRQRSASAG